MNRMLRHRIEDTDFYLGVSLICYALDAPMCGWVALFIFLLILIISIFEWTKDE